MSKISRIFEESKDEEPLTGVSDSRCLPVGEWIEAEEKEGVIDGSDGTEYTSGFHVLETVGECESLLRNFSKPRKLVVAEVRVRGLRPKQHARADVYLTSEMLIPEGAWKNSYITRNKPLP